MHRRYEMSPEFLIEVGKDLYDRNTIRNWPYYHYITVATNRFEWDAISAYLAHRDNDSRIPYAVNGYVNSAAYTLSYIDRSSAHNLIGFHKHTLDTKYLSSLLEFVNLVSHELQHCIVFNEDILKIQSVNENEPRAYVSGRLLKDVLGILANEWDLVFLAKPMLQYPAIAAAGSIPPTILSKMKPIVALSGMIDAHISNMNGVVSMCDNTWASTTFYTGGN